MDYIYNIYKIYIIFIMHYILYIYIYNDTKNIHNAKTK